MSKVSNIFVSVDPDDVPLVANFSNWLSGDRDILDSSANATSAGVGRLAEVTSYGGWKHPEWLVFAGVLNHANHERVIEYFSRVNWNYPEYAQLWLRNESESFFSLWMFRNGTLRRVTPVPEDVDRDIFPAGMPTCRLQLAGNGDVDFLANLAAQETWKFQGELPPIRDLGTDRRYGVPKVPVAVVALNEVRSSDPADWSWKRIAAGLMWRRPEGDSPSAYVALMVPEPSRQFRVGAPLLRRLADIALVADIYELVCPFSLMDEWSRQAYQDFGFSSTSPDSSGQLRMRLNH